jgi:hypothetical protein
MGSLTWWTVNKFIAESSLIDRFDSSASSPVVGEEAAVPISQPADAVSPQTAQPADEVTPQTAPPPNTHFSATGKLVPDDGCHWLSDEPNDFRVVCK